MELRVLLIAVQPDALNAELPLGNAQVAALMTLVAVAQPTGNPAAVDVGSFPDALDARARAFGRERDDQSLPGNEILVGAQANDQAAVRFDLARLGRCAFERDVQRVVAQPEGLWCVVDDTIEADRRSHADHA